MKVPQFNTSPSQDLRNRFLAALYRKDYTAALTEYQGMISLAEDLFPQLGETFEKHLRQVQVAFKRFVPHMEETTPLRQAHGRLQEILRQMARPREDYPGRVAFPDWETRQDLLPWQWDRIYENAITLQLTSGCSNYCRRCNEWALPRVRSHFTAPALETFITRLNAAGNRDLALYGASDPLDWEDQGRSFADVNGLNQGNYSLLTKLPRGKADILAAMTEKQIPFSVSVTGRNRDRVKSMEARLGCTLEKQHDTDDLLIPAGLDEDFTTIKSSITDAYGTEITPEGVFMILPTFTSALYPMGHQKLPVDSKTPVFPVRKLGREALLVDYFKPLEVVGESGEVFFLERLIPLQVETLLLDTGTLDISPPGMRNLKEYFTIFDQGPCLRRQTMGPSVLKSLKRKCLGDKRYAELNSAEKARYRHKIQSHFDFSTPEAMAGFRLNAAAFFLEAVCDYLDHHPVECQIIRFLTREEFASLAPDAPKDLSLEAQLTALPEDEFFTGFRRMVLELVHRGKTPDIHAFIAAHRARFDAVGDAFIPASN